MVPSRCGEYEDGGGILYEVMFIKTVALYYKVNVCTKGVNWTMEWTADWTGLYCRLDCAQDRSHD